MDLFENVWNWLEDAAFAMKLSTPFFLMAVGILLVSLIFVFVGIRHRWANVISLLGCLFLTGTGVYQIFALGGFQDFSQSGFCPFWILSDALLLLSLIFLFRKQKRAVQKTQPNTTAAEAPVPASEPQTESATVPRSAPAAQMDATDPQTESAAVPRSAPAQATGPKASSSIWQIKLHDTVVHKKDWKQFRKHATQAELAVLAIGSRLRLTGPQFFIKSIVAVVGMILSIVLGLAYTLSEYAQFGIILLVGGYLFFNLLASKQIGYADTYSSCSWKLTGEYSKMIKEMFKENIALTILREILLICLRIITFPYQFILMVIETLIPPAANWTVAHGGSAGAVVTMPKGYNIGNLAALGEYYASCTFGSALEQHITDSEAARQAKFSQYDYIDQNGMRQVAYSDDGRTFYTSTDKLTQVGTSQDGGKTIDLKE